MKKLFAVIMAIVLAFAGIAMNTAADAAVTVNPADLPTAAKETMWAIAYKTRCRNYKAVRRTRKSCLAARVLLLPLMLFMGVAAPIGTGTPSNRFTVSYMKEKKIISRDFFSEEEAVKAYRQIASYDNKMPRRLTNNIGKCPIIIADSNWTENVQKKENAQLWREEARKLLKEARVDKVKVETALTLDVSDLKNIVCGRNIERLMELDGIGEKTAYKIVRALRPISRPSVIKTLKSHEFTRIRLSHTVGTETFFITDTIRKGVSPVEAKAIALGGKDAIITVISKLDEIDEKNVEQVEEREELLDFWRDACDNGIVVNGKRYVFLGHGTNSAKECKTLWVLEEIYTDMRTWVLKGTNPNWKTTPAKKLAYLVGLQNVTRKSTGIPFQPEDFVVYPSVFSDVVGNHTKEFLDGHEEDLDNHAEPVNRSDGYFIVDIPEQMYSEYINRMIARGDDPAEAEEKLMAFVNNHSINSYRCDGVALKGCGDKHVNFHAFAYANGISRAPDGKHLSTKSVFIDETVLKTTIGKGCAYETFEDWADAVREEMNLGVCVKAHAKSKKDVSYQVLQALCETSGETVRKMAQPTIERVNNAHYVDGASRLLGRELGHIARILPEIMKVRNVAERVEKRLTAIINDAFSGKLLRCSYYAFITPDPVYIMQGWLGLEKTGCLESGECHVGGLPYKKYAFWRSPVMHPNSVRVYNNVEIKKEYRRFFKSDEFVIIMNSKDDVSLAAAADWDGDHGSVSDFEPLVEAIEQTQKIWNRLVIWETPKTIKEIVDRLRELEYVKGLTKANELGLTVYGLNALLNRVMKVEDEATGETYTIVVELTHRGINFKVFAGNVLVDASKHGGAEIAEPEESSQCENMLQPWAKTYRDAVKRRQNWKVVLKSVGDVSYFETVSAAKEFAANFSNQKPVVTNYLEELASLNGKDLKHTAGTLNKLFALYSKYIDRSVEIKDLPDKAFDFHKLMFNPEEKRRGLIGLIRKGEKKIMSVDGDSMRLDEGLFNSLARRIEHDRAIWVGDNDRKDKEDTTFEDEWRLLALEEIRNFAEAMGATLEDAYDVITWQMFKYTDEQYASMDGKLDFLRDNLWKAYWLIFGGMAEEAAMRWEKEEETGD